MSDKKKPKAKLPIWEEIASLARSRAGVIWLRTREEVRAERVAAGAADSLKMACKIHSITEGLVDINGKEIRSGMQDPRKMLTALINDDERSMYILEDFSRNVGSDPILKRQLKDVIRALPKLSPEKGKAIVVIDAEPPPADIPGIYEVEFRLPSKDELGRIIEDVARVLPDEKKGAVLELKDEIVQGVAGLEAEEASVALKYSMVVDGEPNLQRIVSRKKSKIQSDGALSWKDPDPRGLDAIGGLGNLKQYLYRRANSLSPEAKDYGVPAPKGILVCGIPGCGKSLAAMCVATAYQLPLLRLDIGAVMGKYVGESDANMRKALETAQAVAPAIIWIDELEKAFAGASGGGDADGGTVTRVFGQFLTFLQENDAGLFVFATANDISKLPPEFLRAGRFDAVFWVDLPTFKEREAIIKVMQGKYPRCGDASGLAAATEGYTGSEIEGAFLAALNIGFNSQPRRDPTAEDLHRGLQDVVPIKETFGEKLEEYRSLAKGCLPASELAETDGAGNGPTFEF